MSPPTSQHTKALFSLVMKTVRHYKMATVDDADVVGEMKVVFEVQDHWHWRHRGGRGADCTEAKAE